MSNTYIQPGEVADYTNSSGSTIAAGSIVAIGGRIGVAAVDIPASETGSAYISGVHRLPKDTGAIGQGDAIDFDVSKGKVTTGLTPATGDVSGCGMAFTAALSADTEAEVLLGFPGGTVTA